MSTTINRMMVTHCERTVSCLWNVNVHLLHLQEDAIFLAQKWSNQYVHIDLLTPRWSQFTTVQFVPYLLWNGLFHTMNYAISLVSFIFIDLILSILDTYSQVDLMTWESWDVSHVGRFTNGL